MGFNLSCVGTCLPHRIDKAICALHPSIAHGQCIALLYPAWAAHGYRKLYQPRSIRRFGLVFTVLLSLLILAVLWLGIHGRLP